MKKSVLIFGLILLGVFLIYSNFISAVITSCSVEQECSEGEVAIMQISGTTNAHAGTIGGGGAYEYVLCCDGGESATCSGTNKILSLSATTNAHAEIASQTNYDTDVCYGDVSYYSQSGSCNEGDFQVLSISGQTNAHLGSFSQYGLKICGTAAQTQLECGNGVIEEGETCDDSNFDDGDGCSSVCEIEPDYTCEGEPSVCDPVADPTAYWAAFPQGVDVFSTTSQTPIVMSSSTYVVVAVVENSGLPEGQTTFSIWEDDSNDDEIRTSIQGSVDEEGRATATWEINLDDLDNALDGANGQEKSLNDNFEFYFKLDNSGSIIGQSGILHLDYSPDFCEVNNIFLCLDYSDQNNCNVDTCDVAEFSVQEINEDIDCENDYECVCSWDSESSVCEPSWSSGEENTDGDCGSDHGGSFVTDSDMENLCDTGFASDVSAVGSNWEWTCYGTGEDSSDSSCSATITGGSVDGVCEDKGSTVFSNSDDLEPLCASGDEDLDGIGFNDETNNWEWTCYGTGEDSSDSSCSAIGPSSLTNGICGSDDGKSFSTTDDITSFCEDGLRENMVYDQGTGVLTWDCGGLNGGSDDSCSATISSGGGSGAVCGNNIQEVGETCDGTDLDGFTCSDLSSDLSGNGLVCNSQCNGFLTNFCTGYFCDNDGVLETGEICDGGLFTNNLTCLNFDSFTGGSLKCTSDCNIVDDLCLFNPNQENNVGTCVYHEDLSGDVEGCDDGFLEFSWTHTWTWDSGCDSACQSQNAEARNECQDGSTIVQCPAEIQLPAFGTYGFIITILLIVLIYFIISKKRHKK